MRKLEQITFLSIIFIIIVAFNFQHNPLSNWYQQYLPNIYTQQINDITFIDSLTGFIVTSRNVNPDTATILKTTNGGDNWIVVFNQPSRRFSTIKLINDSTGFVCGGTGTGLPFLYKTTNTGQNWATVPILNTQFIDDMEVLNSDTIWLADGDALVGGVYSTTNGGLNWTRQLSVGSYNPDVLYMYDKNFGFASKGSSQRIYRTTNGGESWDIVANQYMDDIQFANSLTGWRSNDQDRDSSIRKTTDGGLTWVKQILPGGSAFYGTVMKSFSMINKDTLWGVGGTIIAAPGRYKAVIYKTTNGGNNWGYQIPDTSFNIGILERMDFLDKNHGWAYANYSPPKGVHTTTGGDSITYYTGIQQISNIVPDNLKLEQNYPNPFNPVTNIRYSLKKPGFVSLRIFNVQGKEISNLVNQKQQAGEYQYSFEAVNLSSGIYFYTLQTENFSETKKMMLIK